MSQEISSPLASIIKRAMESKATGPVASAKEKVAKRNANASDEVLVVCDLSGSMVESIGGLNVSKFRHLEIAVADIRKRFPKIRVIGFHSIAFEINSPNLPLPTGGTDLARALDFARQWKPRKTIIISDGLPDDPDAAQGSANRLTGVVDTIYCGPDGHPAIEFLRSLSNSTGGTSLAWDGYQTQLAANIRGLLGPA